MVPKEYAEQNLNSESCDSKEEPKEQSSLGGHKGVLPEKELLLPFHSTWAQMPCSPASKVCDGKDSPHIHT